MTGSDSVTDGDGESSVPEESLPTQAEPFAETCSIGEENICSQCGGLIDLQGDDAITCHHCGGLSLAMKVTPKPQPDDLVIIPERFSVERVIGEGAFGIVYKAWDARLQRHVALKMPKRNLTSKYLLAREARAAASLRHMNIVRIYDVVETEDTVFIVSDFIEGPSLARYRMEKTVDIPTACRLAIAIARAMQHAHDQGVIHRDLKPSNIVLDLQGNPHVLDFGLSRSRSQGEGSLVRRGHPIGTLAFMSPEQAVGDIEKIGVTSDVYSLGIILYQLLANHLPFSGDSEEILHAVVNRSPPSIQSFKKEISPALSAVVEKALAKDPAVRYQSATEFADDLDAFLAGQRLQAYRRVDRRVLRRWLRIGLIPASAAGLLIALVFVGRALRVEQVRNRDEIGIVVETKPPGALTVWQRFDPVTGKLESQQYKEQGEGTSYLKSGFYKVKAEEAGRKAEVFRTVPGKTDVMFNGAGVVYPHRNWAEKDGEFHAFPIELQVPNPNDDAIFVQGGRLKIGNDRTIAPLFRNIDVEVDSFWITRQELGLVEVKAAFPNFAETGLSYEVAAAYAEKVGASLPTVEEYLYIDASKVELPGLRDGLLEWTETPMREMTVEIPGASHTYPGDLTKRLMLKSLSKEVSPEIFEASLTHAMYFRPEKYSTIDSGAGFRLVWR